MVSSSIGGAVLKTARLLVRPVAVVKVSNAGEFTLLLQEESQQ